MLQEFKTFIVRGNMIDLAVGIVIGGAFGKIVTSLVNDIIMPPIGVFTNRIDFANLFIDLSGQGYKTLAEAKAAGAATLNYGAFINNIVDFLLVGFAIFLLIKGISIMRKKEEAKPTLPPQPTAEEKLLVEIRDLLRAKA